MGEIAKQLPQHPYTRISSNMNYALKRGKLSRRKQDGFYRYYPTSYFLLTHEEPKRLEIPQLKPMAEPERLKWIVAEAQRYFWDTQNDNLRDFINYLKETYRG